jgi:hypothetical protein
VVTPRYSSSNLRRVRPIFLFRGFPHYTYFHTCVTMVFPGRFQDAAYFAFAGCSIKRDSVGHPRFSWAWATRRLERRKPSSKYCSFKAFCFRTLTAFCSNQSTRSACRGTMRALGLPRTKMRAELLQSASLGSKMCSRNVRLTQVSVRRLRELAVYNLTPCSLFHSENELSYQMIRAGAVAVLIHHRGERASRVLA